MTKLIIFITLLFLTRISFAIDYRCTLDLSKDGMELTKDIIKKHVKVFNFNSSKKKVGTSVNFNNINLKIWVKNKMTIVMIKDLDRKIVVTGKFSPKQELLYLKLSPSIEMKCMTTTEWNKNQIPILQNLYIPKVNDNSDLGQLQHNIFFKINKEIIFRYIHEDSNDRMRILFFQDGNIIRNSQYKDNAKPWCAFQVEIKLDEDTYIYPGTTLPPSKVKLLKSGGNHSVISYSFIDFSSGKRTFHTSRFTPFSLECKIPLAEKLSYKRFKSITGNYFKLITKDD